MYKFTEIISAQDINQIYSYYYMKTHFFQFLDYLSYRGLVIKYFCVDSIMQDDKTDVMNMRASSGVDRLLDCIDSNFSIGSFAIVEN